ncbi:hypothetical protein ACVDG5_012460 [Mesorhizobium sp. ORM6]
MRVLIVFAASFGLALALPVFAQSTGSPAGPALPNAVPDQNSPAQSSADQNFANVVIVAIQDLPTSVKAQAEALVSKTSAEDLLRLQHSIDASPQVTKALAAYGLNSSQVVAANIGGDGTLTLIIQTTT